jgi:hypothetical protein
MSERFLEPSSAGLRKPTDPQKDNGQIINQPRYAEHGGLDKPSRVAQKNPLNISKPNGGRS